MGDNPSKTPTDTDREIRILINHLLSDGLTIDGQARLAHLVHARTNSFVRLPQVRRIRRTYTRS